MTLSLDRTPVSVLVVDDEPDLCTLYELTLLREGYGVRTAGSLKDALDTLQSASFDAVITDMRLPDGTGLDLLREMARIGRPEKSIVITAYGSAENAVEALKAGAFDYLTKPVDLKAFRATVAQLVGDRQRNGRDGEGSARRAGADSVRRHDTRHSAAPTKVSQALGRLVGQSEPICRLRQQIEKVALSMAPVLVRGESGTGKELVARSIHDCSHRAAGPFVAVNCGAIPESLLEAEFFGVRKGAYTGATHDRQGYFQAATGGTLFLDEIGDLPLAMQSKLLRVIQERRVRPIGATQEEAVDVRIVSATHKDLATEVHSGCFRQDLFYRLNVIELKVPALRERKEDLPLLCESLLQRIAQESGVPPQPLSPATMEQILRHPLTGNVRELENLLHRALALGDGGDLGLDIAAPAGLVPPGEPRPQKQAPFIEPPLPNVESDATIPDNLQAWLDEREREVLQRALILTRFNRTAAAQRLGLNLRQMRYRMARLNIAAPGSAGGETDEPTD